MPAGQHSPHTEPLAPAEAVLCLQHTSGTSPAWLTASFPLAATSGADGAAGLCVIPLSQVFFAACVFLAGDQGRMRQCGPSSSV